MSIDDKDLSLIIKGLLNTMIPKTDEEFLPCGSDAINIDLFIKFINGNENIKKILVSLLPKNFNDLKNDIDYLRLGSTLVTHKELENLIEDYVLNCYFTSEVVLTLLSSRDTLDNIEYDDNLNKNKILEYLKNS